MCKRVWRNAQDCAVKQGLTTRICGWLAAGKPLNDAHEWSVQRRWTVMLAGALQDKKSRLAILFACDSIKSRGQVANQLYFEKLDLRIPFLLQYKYPLYPRNVESFQREFYERNPREKQDWLIHNLHIETFQIPLLSSSPLLHPWEVHYQNLFLPY